MVFWHSPLGLQDSWLCNANGPFVQQWWCIPSLSYYQNTVERTVGPSKGRCDPKRPQLGLKQKKQHFINASEWTAPLYLCCSKSLQRETLNEWLKQNYVFACWNYVNKHYFMCLLSKSGPNVHPRYAKKFEFWERLIFSLYSFDHHIIFACTLVRWYESVHWLKTESINLIIGTVESLTDVLQLHWVWSGDFGSMLTVNEQLSPCKIN